MNKISTTARPTIASASTTSRATEKYQSILLNLKKQLKNYTEDDISIDFQGFPIGDEGIKIIKKCLEENPKIYFLEFLNTKLKDKDAQDLISILENITTITALSLENSIINDTGFTIISEFLKNNTTLEILNLSENGINDDIALLIAEVLKTNSTLRELYLSVNSISDEGATTISEALKFNHFLRKLDLSRNSISDADGSIIATIIKFNSTLQEIQFCDNYIKNESTIAISEGLKFNTSLSRLDLSNNCILAQGIKHIADALLSNQSITELKLSINIIDSDHFIEPIQEFIKTIENLNFDINHEGKHQYSIANVRRLHYKDNSTINRLAVKANNIENVEFLKAYLTIQKICNRNRQKEFLVARATPILQKLAPETPTEIADLLARELLITESGAETLRRVGDLI